MVFKNPINLYLRSISFILVILFSWDTVVWSQPNVGVSNSRFHTSEQGILTSGLYELSIPESIGSVEARHLPKTPSSKPLPFIIHIQDAHAHPEAQRNIQSILEYLTEQKQIDKVAIEGAFGKIDPSVLDLLPIPELNDAMAQHLADMGELTGAELFALKQKGAQVEVIGVDDQKLYEQSFLLFQKVKSEEKNIQAALDVYDRLLEKLEPKIFNERLRSYAQKRRLWSQRGDEFFGYFMELAVLAKEFLNLELNDVRNQFEWPNITRIVKSQEVEPRLHMQIVRSERDALVHEIESKISASKRRDFLLDGLRNLLQEKDVPPFQSWIAGNKRLPNVTSIRHFFEVLHSEAKKKDVPLSNHTQFFTYGALLILREEVDAKALFKEVGKLETKLEEKLIHNELEKALLGFEKDFLLIKHLLNLGVTREEYESYGLRKKELTSQAIHNRLKQFISKDASQKIKLPFLSKQTMEIAEQFYVLSRKRDDALLENTLKITDGKKSNSQKAIVLITGGFHSEGLTQLLKEKEIPHLVLSPKMTRFENADLYEKVMLGKHTGIDHLLTYESALAAQILLQPGKIFQQVRVMPKRQQTLFLKELLSNGVPGLQARGMTPREIHKTLSQILSQAEKNKKPRRVFEGLSIFLQENPDTQESILILRGAFFGNEVKAFKFTDRGLNEIDPRELKTTADSYQPQKEKLKKASRPETLGGLTSWFVKRKAKSTILKYLQQTDPVQIDNLELFLPFLNAEWNQIISNEKIKQKIQQANLDEAEWFPRFNAFVDQQLLKQITDVLIRDGRIYLYGPSPVEGSQDTIVLEIAHSRTEDSQRNALFESYVEEIPLGELNQFLGHITIDFLGGLQTKLTIFKILNAQADQVTLSKNALRAILPTQESVPIVGRPGISKLLPTSSVEGDRLKTRDGLTRKFAPLVSLALGSVVGVSVRMTLARAEMRIQVFSESNLQDPDFDLKKTPLLTLTVGSNNLLDRFYDGPGELSIYSTTLGKGNLRNLNALKNAISEVIQRPSLIDSLQGRKKIKLLFAVRGEEKFLIGMIEDQTLIQFVTPKDFDYPQAELRGLINSIAYDIGLEGKISQTEAFNFLIPIGSDKGLIHIPYLIQTQDVPDDRPALRAEVRSVLSERIKNVTTWEEVNDILAGMPSLKMDEIRDLIAMFTLKLRMTDIVKEKHTGDLPSLIDQIYENAAKLLDYEEWLEDRVLIREFLKAIPYHKGGRQTIQNLYDASEDIHEQLMVSPEGKPSSLAEEIRSDIHAKWSRKSLRHIQLVREYLEGNKSETEIWDEQHLSVNSVDGNLRQTIIEEQQSHNLSEKSKRILETLKEMENILKAIFPPKRAKLETEQSIFSTELEEWAASPAVERVPSLAELLKKAANLLRKGKFEEASIAVFETRVLIWKHEDILPNRVQLDLLELDIDLEEKLYSIVSEVVNKYLEKPLNKKYQVYSRLTGMLAQLLYHRGLGSWWLNDRARLISNPTIYFSQVLDLAKLSDKEITDIASKLPRLYEQAAKELYGDSPNQIQMALGEINRTQYDLRWFEYLNNEFLDIVEQELFNRPDRTISGVTPEVPKRIPAFLSLFNHQLSKTTLDHYPSPLHFGGKQVYLAVMKAYDFSIPSSFTIPADVGKFNLHRKYRSAFRSKVLRYLKALNKDWSHFLNRSVEFGNPDRPLLVSIRSGATIGIPGEMPSVLNVGMNDLIVERLYQETRDVRFAFGSYARFLVGYAETVLGLDRRVLHLNPAKAFANPHISYKRAKGIVANIKWVIRKQGQSHSDRLDAALRDPYVQLFDILDAVIDSWNSDKLKKYRSQNELSEQWFTPASITTMVFGNQRKFDGAASSQKFSGYGTFDSRDEKLMPNLEGEFREGSQGEDLIGGHIDSMKASILREEHPELFSSILREHRALENLFNSFVRTETTIWGGRAFYLQVNPETYEQDRASFPKIVEQKPILTRGKIPIYGGAMTGVIVFDANRIPVIKEESPGWRIILAVKYATAGAASEISQANGLIIAEGAGKMSHAASIARTHKIYAIGGVKTLRIGLEMRSGFLGSKELREGDLITIDASTGNIYEGFLKLDLTTDSKTRSELRTGSQQVAIVGDSDRARLLLTEMIKRGISVPVWIAETPAIERLPFLTRHASHPTPTAEETEVIGNRALGNIRFKIHPQKKPIIPIEFTQSKRPQTQAFLINTIIQILRRKKVDTIVLDKEGLLDEQQLVREGFRVIVAGHISNEQSFFETVPTTQNLASFEVGRAFSEFAEQKEARIDFAQVSAIEPNATTIPSTYRIRGAGQLSVSRRQLYEQEFKKGAGLTEETENVPETIRLGYPITQGTILSYVVALNRRTQPFEVVTFFRQLAQRDGFFVIPEIGALLNTQRIKTEVGLYLLDIPIVETTEDGRSFVQISFIADPVQTEIEWIIQRLQGIDKPRVEQPLRTYQETESDWELEEKRQLADLGKLELAESQVRQLAERFKRKSRVEEVKRKLRESQQMSTNEDLSVLFDRGLDDFNKVEFLLKGQNRIGVIGWSKTGEIFSTSLLTVIQPEKNAPTQAVYYEALRHRISSEKVRAGIPLRVRDVYQPSENLSAVWEIDLSRNKFLLSEIVMSQSGKDTVVSKPRTHYKPIGEDELGIFVNGAGGRIGSQIARLLGGDAIAPNQQVRVLSGKLIPVALGISSFRDDQGNVVSGAEGFARFIKNYDPAAGPYIGEIHHGYEDEGQEDWIELTSKSGKPIKIAVLSHPIFRNPENYPLLSFLLPGIPIEAIEATGVFTDLHGINKYLWAGAESAIMTNPGSSKEGRWESNTFVYNINNGDYHSRKTRKSAASCTTSCGSALNDKLQQIGAEVIAGAPLPVLLRKEYRFPMTQVAMTGHSYTGETLGPALSYDPSEKTQGRVVAAGAAYPAPTGFARTGKLIIPEVQATGTGIRGAWPTGSVLLPVVDVPGHWTLEDLRRVSAYGDEPNSGFKLVSDLTSSHQVQRMFGDLASLHAVVDENQIRVVHITDNWGRPRSILSLAAWYENEWGYSLGVVRLLDDVTRSARARAPKSSRGNEFPARLSATPEEADNLYSDRLFLNSITDEELEKLVRGKTVFVRTDYNVVEPRLEKASGELKAKLRAVIVEDFRIRASVPDIKRLQRAGAKVVLASHNGRFVDVVENKVGYSLAPVAEKLAEFLGTPIKFIPEVTGPNVTEQIAAMKEGDVVLLENLRTEPGEEGGDANYAQEIYSTVKPDAYVFVAFGAAHRGEHASISPFINLLRQEKPNAPILGGELIQRELYGIRQFLNDPAAGQRGVAVLGGAKPGDKIEMMGEIIRNRRIKKIIVLGAMSVYFYLAKGLTVGNSFLEEDVEGVEKSVQSAYEIMQLAQAYDVEIILPHGYRGTFDSVDIEGKIQVKAQDIHSYSIAENGGLPAGFFAYSVDEETVKQIALEIQGANWIIVNGTAGLVEVPAFRSENDAILSVIDQEVKVSGARALVLGGDGVAAFSQWAREPNVYGPNYLEKLPKAYTLSTGGGASLQLIAERTLSGLEPIDVEADKAQEKKSATIAVYGNLKWRLRTPEGIRNQLQETVREVQKIPGADFLEIVVFVPADLAKDPELNKIVAGTPVKIGVQNIRLPQERTDDITPADAKAYGYTHVLIGHSDRRRRIPTETNQVVNARLRASLKAQLIPILLYGESLDERIDEIDNPQKFGETAAQQLRESLADVSLDQAREIRFGYEPVWAVGKQAAGSFYANLQLQKTEEVLSQLYGLEVVSELIKGYGGGANERNISSYLSRPLINFVLAGRASVEARAFGSMVYQAARFSRPSSKHFAAWSNIESSIFGIGELLKKLKLEEFALLRILNRLEYAAKFAADTKKEEITAEKNTVLSLIAMLDDIKTQLPKDKISQPVESTINEFVRILNELSVQLPNKISDKTLRELEKITSQIVEDQKSFRSETRAPVQVNDELSLTLLSDEGEQFITYKIQGTNDVLKIPRDQNDDKFISKIDLANRKLTGLIPNTSVVRGIWVKINGRTFFVETAIRQREVEESITKLKMLVNEGRLIEAQNLLKGVFELTRELWRRGVVDPDFKILRGYGWDKADSRVVLYDLSHISDKKEDANTLTDGTFFTSYFGTFNVTDLQTIHPSLVQVYLYGDRFEDALNQETFDRLWDTGKKFEEIKIHGAEDFDAPRAETRHLSVSTTHLTPTEELAVLETFLERLKREKRKPGSANIPLVSFISDQHGTIDKFDALIVDSIHQALPGRLPENFKLDSGEELEEQLSLAGLSFDELRGKIYFHNLGDLMDRGPYGVKVYRRSAELIEAGFSDFVIGNHDLWESLNLWGFHLPWYDGFNFYGYQDIYDQENSALSVSQLVSNHHAKEPETRTKTWWAQKLFEFTRSHEKQQKDQWNKLDIEFNGELDSKGKRVKGTGLYAQLDQTQLTLEQKAAWDKFRGWYQQGGIEVYTGIRAAGLVSVKWWGELLTEFEKAYEGYAHAPPVERALHVMKNEIIPTLSNDLESRLARGEWWARIFEAINWQNYTSVEWWTKDWAYHKDWGTAVLDEINDGLQAENVRTELSNTSQNERANLRKKLKTDGQYRVFYDQGNYLENKTLQRIAGFYRDYFSLFIRDIYQNFGMHAFLPVDLKTGEFFFTYKKIEYRGKGSKKNPSIWEGLDRIARDVRDRNNSFKDLYEALSLVNSWYADRTTRSKVPDVAKAIQTFGANRLAKINGFNRLFTGHLPFHEFSKLKPNDRRFITGSLIGNRIGIVDHGMGERFGSRGASTIVSPNGIQFRGYEHSEHQEIVPNPRTILIDNGTERVLFENDGKPRTVFLPQLIKEVKARIRELKSRAELRNILEQIVQMFLNHPVVGTIGVSAAAIGFTALIWRTFFPVSWYLFRFKHSSNWDRSFRTHDALIKLGAKKVLRPLIQKLDDREVASLAVEVLSNLGGEQAFQALLSKLSDSSRYDRYFIVANITKFKDSRTVEPLLELLKSFHSSDRSAAAFALGELNDQRAVEPLIGLLKDSDGLVRANVISALASFGGSRVVESLVSTFTNPQYYHRYVGFHAYSGREQHPLVLEALRKLNVPQEVIFNGYLQALQSDILIVRQTAVMELGKLGNPRAVEPLIDRLKDHEVVVRREAVHSLQKLGDSKAVEPLIEKLKDSDQQVRSSAIGAIGELGDQRAVEPLVALLGQDNDEQLVSAIRALIKLGFNRFDETRAVEVLSRIVVSDRPIANTADVLVALAGDRAIGSLLQVLSKYQNANYVNSSMGGVGPDEFTVSRVVDIVDKIEKASFMTKDRSLKESVLNTLDLFLKRAPPTLEVVQLHWQDWQVTGEDHSFVPNAAYERIKSARDAIEASLRLSGDVSPRSEARAIEETSPAYGLLLTLASKFNDFGAEFSFTIIDLEKAGLRGEVAQEAIREALKNEWIKPVGTISMVVRPFGANEVTLIFHITKQGAAIVNPRAELREEKIQTNETFSGAKNEAGVFGAVNTARQNTQLEPRRKLLEDRTAHLQTPFDFPSFAGRIIHTLGKSIPTRMREINRIFPEWVAKRPEPTTTTFERSIRDFATSSSFGFASRFILIFVQNARHITMELNISQVENDKLLYLKTRAEARSQKKRSFEDLIKEIETKLGSLLKHDVSKLVAEENFGTLGAIQEGYNKILNLMEQAWDLIEVNPEKNGEMRQKLDKAYNQLDGIPIDLISETMWKKIKRNNHILKQFLGQLQGRPLSKILKRFRQQIEMTQKKLANELNIGVRTYIRLETGEANASHYLRAIANYYIVHHNFPSDQINETLGIESSLKMLNRLDRTKKLNAKIKDLRETFSLSQSELAKKLGVTTRTYQRLESEENSLEFVTSVRNFNLRKLATIYFEIFDIPHDELLKFLGFPSVSDLLNQLEGQEMNKLLISLREFTGRTQKQMARISGVTLRIYSGYEAGEPIPLSRRSQLIRDFEQSGLPKKKLEKLFKMPKRFGLTHESVVVPARAEVRAKESSFEQEFAQWVRIMTMLMNNKIEGASITINLTKRRIHFTAPHESSVIAQVRTVIARAQGEADITTTLLVSEDKQSFKFTVTSGTDNAFQKLTKLIPHPRAEVRTTISDLIERLKRKSPKFGAMRPQYKDKNILDREYQTRSGVLMDQVENDMRTIQSLVQPVNALSLEEISSKIVSTNLLSRYRIKRGLPVTYIFRGDLVPNHKSEAKPRFVAITIGGFGASEKPAPRMRDKILGRKGEKAILLEDLDLGKAMYDKNPWWDVWFDGGKNVFVAEGKRFVAVNSVFSDVTREEDIVAKGGNRWYGIGNISDQDKENMIRQWVASSISAGALLNFYITGPDMYMGEDEMAWIVDEANRVQVDLGFPYKILATTSRNLKFGSFNHVKWMATSIAVTEGILAALGDEKIRTHFDIPEKVTIALQGFGDVSSGIIRYLWQNYKEELTSGRIKIVGVSDSKGGIYHKEGLDIQELIRLIQVRTDKLRRKQVFSLQAEYSGPNENTGSDEVLFKGATVVIPAAQPDIVKTPLDIQRLKAAGTRLYAEGANNSYRPNVGLEKVFHKEKILLLAGNIVNGGGIFASTEEVYHSWMDGRAMPRYVEERRDNLDNRRIHVQTQIADIASANGRLLFKEFLRRNGMVPVFDINQEIVREIRAHKRDLLNDATNVELNLRTRIDFERGIPLKFARLINAAEIAREEAYPDLIFELRNPTSLTNLRYAIYVSGKKRVPDAAPILRDIVAKNSKNLKNKLYRSSLVRRAAAEALGHIGDADSKKILRSVIHNPREKKEVRVWAKWALDRITDTERVEIAIGQARSARAKTRAEVRAIENIPLIPNTSLTLKAIHELLGTPRVWFSREYGLSVLFKDESSWRIVESGSTFPAYPKIKKRHRFFKVQEGNYRGSQQRSEEIQDPAINLALQFIFEAEVRLQRERARQTVRVYLKTPKLTNEDFQNVPEQVKAEFMRVFEAWYESFFVTGYDRPDPQQEDQEAQKLEEEGVFAVAVAVRVSQMGYLIKEGIKKGLSQQEIVQVVSPVFEKALEDVRNVKPNDRIQKRRRRHMGLSDLNDLGLELLRTQLPFIVSILMDKYKEYDTWDKFTGRSELRTIQLKGKDLAEATRFYRTVEALARALQDYANVRMPFNSLRYRALNPNPDRKKLGEVTEKAEAARTRLIQSLQRIKKPQILRHVLQQIEEKRQRVVAPSRNSIVHETIMNYFETGLVNARLKELQKRSRAEVRNDKELAVELEAKIKMIFDEIDRFHSAIRRDRSHLRDNIYRTSLIPYLDQAIQILSQGFSELVPVKQKAVELKLHLENLKITLTRKPSTAEAETTIRNLFDELSLVVGVSRRAEVRNVEETKRQAAEVTADLPIFVMATNQEKQLLKVLAGQKRDLAAVIGVALMAFGFIEPALAVYELYFGLVLFGLGFERMRGEAFVQKIHRLGTDSSSVQKTREVVLIGVDDQIPLIDLKALGLRPGERVIVLDSFGGKTTFDFYSRIRIPGVNVVRRESQGRQASLGELQRILSERPHSFPIVVFPSNFGRSELRQYHAAARREGYLASAPWTEAARGVFSDLLGRIPPDRLGRLGLGDVLEYDFVEQGLSSLKVSVFNEPRFVNLLSAAFKQFEAVREAVQKAA